ncbi:unnamed protein product [Penicillium nalgiovense]|nr:unnamed protein product [Penicillium nalgiovense]
MQRSPAENLLTQRSPAGLTCHHSVPLRSSLGNAAPPARIIVDADLSCETQLISQSLSCETQLITQSLSCETQLLTQSLSCETQLLTQSLSCETQLITQSLGCGELGNAAVSCRELVNAAVSCGSHLSSQRPPAEFTCRGHGDSQARSSPQAREGHHDTTECEDRSPDIFWAGNRAPFIFFGYVSTKEPVAQLVARVTVSLISVEAISTTLKGCLETLWPTEPSLDLAIFLSKLCVECGEPLSSTVEKKATPQKYGSYISSNLQLNRSTRLHCTCPRLNHGHRFLMRVEVLRQMPI